MKKILIIEDDTDIRSQLGELLERKYETKQYRDGSPAYHALKSGHETADLILLDLQMPEMNGWQFISLIEKDPELDYLLKRIMLISAFPNAISDAYMRGFPVITKPFESLEVIENKIDDFMAKNEALTK